MPVKWGFSRHGRTEASTAGRPRLSVRGQLPTSIVTRSCKCIPVALVCSVFLGASVRCPYHGMRAPKIEKHPEWPPNGAKPALAKPPANQPPISDYRASSAHEWPVNRQGSSRRGRGTLLRKTYPQRHFPRAASRCPSPTLGDALDGRTQKNGEKPPGSCGCFPASKNRGSCCATATAPQLENDPAALASRRSRAWFADGRPSELSESGLTPRWSRQQGASMARRRSRQYRPARKRNPHQRINPTAPSSTRIPEDKDVIFAIAGTYFAAPDAGATLAEFHRVVVASLVDRGFNHAGVKIAFRRMLNRYMAPDSHQSDIMDG